MASDRIEAIADKGYYKGEQIVACEVDGIAVTVSKPHTSNAAAHGRFDRADFTYIADDDAYVCPAGSRLIYRFTNEEAGKVLHSYWTDACGSCAIKNKCTTGKERRIRRWEHEAILERVQKRLDDVPEKIPLRSKTVEHPFGTIKGWMGATHFKMKTLKHVATEMALHVLAYNLKRVNGDHRRAAATQIDLRRVSLSAIRAIQTIPGVLTQPLCLADLGSDGGGPRILAVWEFARKCYGQQCEIWCGLGMLSV